MAAVAAAAMVIDPKPFETDTEDDLYMLMKCVQRQLQFIKIKGEYVKQEHKNLNYQLLGAQEEVKRIRSVPLVIGQIIEMIDQNYGIVGSTTGSYHYVRILSSVNRELLKPSASVALHRDSNALVHVLPLVADSSISLLSQSEKPDVSYTVRTLYPTASNCMFLRCFVLFYFSSRGVHKTRYDLSGLVFVVSKLYN